LKADPSSTLRPIGTVASTLTGRAGAPKQGQEGGPEAWLVFDGAYADGLRDLADVKPVLDRVRER
jgi:tRNA (Thr-GGU) A37 N-methylase